MRARTVNESLGFKRTGSAKETLEVGRNNIEDLIKKSIIPKAENHKWHQYQEWEMDGVISYGRTLEIEGDGIHGIQSVSTNISLYEIDDIDLYGKKGLDEFTRCGHIVEIERYSTIGPNPYKYISTYYNPFDLWDESWWEKIDEHDRNEGFKI